MSEDDMLSQHILCQPGYTSRITHTAGLPDSSMAALRPEPHAAPGQCGDVPLVHWRRPLPLLPPPVGVRHGGVAVHVARVVGAPRPLRLVVVAEMD